MYILSLWLIQHAGLRAHVAEAGWGGPAAVQVSGISPSGIINHNLFLDTVVFTYDKGLQ